MEATGALQPITSHPVVGDRPGRRQPGDAEAFQRALREQARGDDADEGAGDAEHAERPAPRRPAAGSGDETHGHHVDVLA